MPTASQNPEVIYLIATSGHPNLGDEFITAAWLRFLAEVRPEAEIWLDCPQPGIASHLYAGLHPRLRTTDVIFRVVWESRELEPDEAFAHIDHRLRHLGTPRYDIGLLGARRASMIHILGGGYINALWPHHEGLLRAARTLKELSGATLAATGLGLTPFAHVDRVREELTGFDHVTVRDQASVEGSGAELAPDDSLLGLHSLPGLTTRAQTVQQDSDVWLCLQSDLADDGAFESAIAAAREFLADPAIAGRNVWYAEGIPGADRVAYDRLSDLIPEDNFVSFLKLWRDGFPARPGQIWFTTRYHFHLLAAACGAAGTAVEINDDFYRAKHQSLLEAGTGWGLVRSGEKVPAAPSFDPQFRVTATSMHRRKLLEAEKLYPRRASEPAPVVEAPTARRGWMSRSR